MVATTASKLEKRRRSALKSRERDKHVYFQGIAEARYVLRRIFRIAEERAKTSGIDPLAHQALIQIYGTPDKKLRVKEIAERLDIASAFASTLITKLAKAGYVVRARDGKDGRASQISITKTGIALLHKIDESVAAEIEAFSQALSPEKRELVVSILMTYVGVSINLPQVGAR